MDLDFLSLFSGVGLHDLGLERAGWKCIGQCECNEFGQAVLRKHWPCLPIWKDVRDVTKASVAERCGRLPLLVTGGFPCQDISAAGKGKGIGTQEEPTEVSGLWWEMRRVIDDLRPNWVLIENTPPLRTRGADAVLSSLEEIEYSGWPLLVGSWAVGAPHKRDRVWLVANNVRKRERRQDGQEGRGLRAGDGCEIPAFASPGEGSPECGYSHERSATLFSTRWPARPGGPQHEWESPRLLEPRVGCPTDGAARRLARRRTAQLRAISNANPPQVVELIGRIIKGAMEDLCASGHK